MHKANKKSFIASPLFYAEHLQFFSSSLDLSKICILPPFSDRFVHTLRFKAAILPTS